MIDDPDSASNVPCPILVLAFEPHLAYTAAGSHGCEGSEESPALSDWTTRPELTA